MNIIKDAFLIVLFRCYGLPIIGLVFLFWFLAGVENGFESYPGPANPPSAIDMIEEQATHHINNRGRWVPNHHIGLIRYIFWNKNNVTFTDAMGWQRDYSKKKDSVAASVAAPAVETPKTLTPSEQVELAKWKAEFVSPKVMMWINPEEMTRFDAGTEQTATGYEHKGTPGYDFLITVSPADFNIHSVGDHYTLAHK